MECDDTSLWFYCLSLIASVTEYFFRCFLAICISYFEKCLLRSLGFFLTILFVLFLNFLSSVFWILIYHMHGLQIFCPILLDVCSLYDHFLYCAKASEFHIVQLFSFDFVPHAFEVLSKKLYPTPGSWSVSPVFSFNNFIVLGLKFRSLIHLELIFVYKSYGSSFIHIYISIYIYI